MLRLVIERTPLRRGPLTPTRERQVSGSENGKSILLLWLNVLGWQVDVKEKGDELFGVARHIAADGSSFRVSGRGATRDDLAFQLFEAALRVVDGSARRRPLLAA
jgi:hypothetical protein